MEVGTWRDGLRPVVRLANKLMLVFVPAAGYLACTALANKMFPRDSTADSIGAIVGVTIGVVIWWPLSRWLIRIVNPVASGTGLNR